MKINSIIEMIKYFDKIFRKSFVRKRKGKGTIKKIFISFGINYYPSIDF